MFNYQPTELILLPLILLQIRHVALQELLPPSVAQGVHRLVEPTAINQVAAVQRIHLRRALASEMCGLVLCFVDNVCAK
jgi:hypothetical protein